MQENKMNIVVNFSSGRSSALMAKLVKEHYKDHNVLFIMANTSKEREESLLFADQCDKHFDLDLVWVEAKINQEKGKGIEYSVTNYESALRNGELFEQLIRKFGLPSKNFRFCTRDLKERPIEKYCKEFFNGEPYFKAIGIRADEQHRISNKPDYIYPLNDFGVDSLFVRKWWDRQPFDLQLLDYEGNCDLCFLKSIRKKKTIIREGKIDVSWWQKMEEEHSCERQPIFDVYRELSIKELVELSKQPFNLAKDELELHKQNPTFDFDEDIEFDCFCKSN